MVGGEERIVFSFYIFIYFTTCFSLKEGLIWLFACVGFFFFLILFNYAPATEMA